MPSRVSLASFGHGARGDSPCVQVVGPKGARTTSAHEHSKMPVYFGHAVTQRGDKKIDVSDSLKQLGINLLRAAPSQVVCDVLPYVSSPLWSFFLASLSALMFAASKQVPVSLNLIGYRIDSKHPHPLPWHLPRISIEVKNKGPKQLEWLLENGFEEQEIRGKSYFICEEPTSNILQPLLGGTSGVDFNDRNYVPLRTSNMSALLILSEMYNTLSFLSIFMRNYLYGSSLPTRATLIDSLGAEISSTLRSGMDVDTEGDRAPTTSLVPSGISAILEYFPALTTFQTGPSDQEVAKAASSISTAPFLSPNDLSHSFQTSGLFLRFVPDLSDEDPTGVVSFFSKYLRRSLGNTSQEIFERLDDYRAAWGILKSTDAGHVLSHLVRCFEIGFDACCGVVPIFSDGFYEGCALIGTGFTLNFRTELFLPLHPGDFATELMAMETNKRLLDKILSILRKADVTIGSVSDISKPAALRRNILLADIDSEGKTILMALVRKVRFPYSKWSVTLGSIIRFCSLLKGPIDDIPDETPVGPEGMFSIDPVEVLMSCFKAGTCPSFRHPSGVPIDLSARKPPSAPVESQSKKGKGPGQVNNGGWVFSIRRVDIVEAVSDFRTLVKEKEARSLGSAASRGLGYFVLSGGNFERVFHSLKDVIGSIDPTSVADTHEDIDMGVKRGRDGGYDDVQVNPKRRVFL